MLVINAAVCNNTDTKTNQAYFLQMINSKTIFFLKFDKKFMGHCSRKNCLASLTRYLHLFLLL